ncbi:unnamed protein product, partial [Iphiclides podalirius]
MSREEHMRPQIKGHRSLPGTYKFRRVSAPIGRAAPRWLGRPAARNTCRLIRPCVWISTVKTFAPLCARASETVRPVACKLARALRD